MVERSSRRLLALRRAAWASAGLAILLGTTVLTGWVLNVPVLKAVFPGESAMQPGAAVLLVVTGVGACLLASPRSRSGARTAARYLGLGVAAVGLLIILEHLAAFDLRFDSFLLSRSLSATALPDSRLMASAGAFSFFLLGCALLTYDLSIPRWLGYPSQVLALVAMLVPLHSFIVRIYGIWPLAGLTSHPYLPLPTGAGLALLSAALILDRSDSGFVRIFVGPGLAGSMARPVAAVSALLPVVLGWLFLVAELRLGRDHVVLGVSLVVTAAIAIGGMVVWWTAMTLAGTERERARAEATEQAARAEAERASRAKDEFIATVSHELRTPLNAVLGWARLLRIGKLDQEAKARAIEAIERNAHTQAKIVDDLLDVSRIVRGELKLDIRSVDLVPIIEAAIETMRPAAQARNTAIIAVLEQKTGPVSGDPGRLQQVIWNLLSNAIKFTPPGGRVEVRLDRQGEDVRIQVKDTGVGIDPTFAPHLFQRFRQADSSSTRVHGGLGIGLAIVRHLVEAHGGTVSAQSEGVGRGAIFAVRLPSFARRSRLLLPQFRQSAPVAEDILQSTPSLRALRILIVDDDADTLEVVKELLEQAGAEVIAAASAAEALQMLQHRSPDVLLSDIGMPGEDGYSLIRKVRNLAPAQGGTVPAAALTAYSQAENRRQVLEAGYQEYLSKPIDPSELTIAVARLARRQDRGRTK